jgi:hypothetical protein
MKEFLKKYKGLVITGVVVLIVLIVAGSLYGNVNSLRNTAIQKEAALVAQYGDNQNELSTYIVQFKESLGVADQGSERLEGILVEAVKGRYDGKMEPGDSGSLFSAITEAYPDLTATTESYAKVQDLVVSGRNAYKNKQSKLLDMIRDYNTWRETDFIDSWIIRNVINAPTDSLKVTVGSNTFRGEDALDKISQIVLVQDAVDSYDTGVLEPLIGDDSE